MRISEWAELSRSARRTAYTAVYLSAALALSYVEAVLPLSLWLPLPGCKPGLANGAILLCAEHMGIGCAAAVAAGRWLCMGMLFGTGASWMLSLAGAALSFAAMTVLLCLPKAWRSRYSAVGVSAVCAVCHMAGQLICASALLGYGWGLLKTYGGVACTVSALFGAVNGVWVNGLSRRMNRGNKTDETNRIDRKPV